VLVAVVCSAHIHIRSYCVKGFVYLNVVVVVVIAVNDAG
jgi:hypothetical protein